MFTVYGLLLYKQDTEVAKNEINTVQVCLKTPVIQNKYLPVVIKT